MSIFNDSPDDARCLAVADYVTTQWIEGGLTLRQWNHFGSQGPRTNNHVEGWHHRLQVGQPTLNTDGYNWVFKCNFFK
jgi:hypothetical protein